MRGGLMTSEFGVRFNTKYDQRPANKANAAGNTKAVEAQWHHIAEMFLTHFQSKLIFS
jgi:hypothetical protein